MKYIEIVGAKQNNLKSLNLKIPIGSFTVICGPSGSGKSSLAFNTLFAEGQRHYTQTLSNYARQYIQELPRPSVKYINNIPPALALEQKNSVRSSRPTVATMTELTDLFRLLFTHLGQVSCPEHNTPLCSFSPLEGAKIIQKKLISQRGMISFPVFMKASFKKKLIQEGFRRVWWKDQRTKNKFPVLHDLKSSLKIPVNKEVYMVLDRLDFRDLDRLTDSIQLAYKTALQYNDNGKAGRAVVSGIEDETFILSENPSCPLCSYDFPFFPLQPSFFNFNSSLGACSSCRGFGNHLALDENKIVPQPKKSIAEGAIVPFTMPSTTAELRSLKKFCRSQNIDLHRPWEKLPLPQRKKIWNTSAGFIGIKGFFDYLETKKYKMHVRVLLARYKSPKACVECGGHRFRKEVSYVSFKGKTLPELLSMDIGSVRAFFKNLSFTKAERKKADEIFKKVMFILDGLNDIGLHYLKLDRLVKTLSSGEYQRLNLVHQLGLGLSQVLYVLDEPTVGLHSKDSLRLIELLKKLQGKGNTLVVVEHDPDVIKAAGFIVEMGPGSGRKGGKLVFVGQKKLFLNKSSSLTGRYLNSKRKKKQSEENKPLPVDLENYKYFLEISGCRAHNLKDVNLRVPLNRLVTVTGVSGSGKSTIVSNTLFPALARGLKKKVTRGHSYKKLKGVQYLREVVRIDSSSVERTKRSLPVTYLKIYDSIRALMASHCDKSGNIRPGFFSLNVEGGRCPHCKGLGYREIQMVFMDSVCIPCEECKGQRFKEEILNLKWRDKNINQILNMTVDKALEFFVSWPSIWKPLSLLKKVGLGYLVLGQNLSTLSGGESQRLKLTRELLNIRSKNTLYILDEPTVGLHFQEVEMLLELLRELIQKGNSVLLIEHNMDLIRRSDYLIDMGPGAGPEGGQIIAQGSPLEVSRSTEGFTSSILRKQLNI